GLVDDAHASAAQDLNNLVAKNRGQGFGRDGPGRRRRYRIDILSRRLILGLLRHDAPLYASRQSPTPPRAHGTRAGAPHTEIYGDWHKKFVAAPIQRRKSPIIAHPLVRAKCPPGV